MLVADVVPLPPLDLMSALSGSNSEEDFRRDQRVFRQLFLNPGGLKPTDRVLEVGSGIGRMAAALGDYLAPPGGYDGLEIVAAGTRWCADHITPVRPHFRFRHADVYNASYNPDGPVRARTYRFPFADATFDFVFLTSVFTHLLPADAVHYLFEVARVLKPGGRLFATFFLVEQDRLARIRAGGGDNHFRLMHRYGKPQLPAGEPVGYDDCFVANPTAPERAVGYNGRWVADQLRGCGLTPDATTYYGSWAGQPSEWDGQDVVCATKTGSPSLGHRLKKALRMNWLREWRWRLAKR